MNDNHNEPVGLVNWRAEQVRKLDGLASAEVLASRGQLGMLCGDFDSDVTPTAHLAYEDPAQMEFALVMAEPDAVTHWLSCRHGGGDLSVSDPAGVSDHQLHSVDG